MLYKSIFVFFIVQVFLLFTFCSESENKFVNVDNKSFFLNNRDSINFGYNSLSKDFFKFDDSIFFPFNVDKYIQQDLPNVYFDIEGVYINDSIFSSFFKVKNKIKKMDNRFDVIYLFAEKSRYNFQFTNIVKYRLFHYFGFFYSIPSSRENLPGNVDSIKILNSNSIKLLYSNNRDALNSVLDIDTMILTTYPTISIKVPYLLEGFQKSKNYIKVSDDILKNVVLTTDEFHLSPQDFNELYIREVITKLLNLKYNSRFKTEEIADNLIEE